MAEEREEKKPGGKCKKASRRNPERAARKVARSKRNKERRLKRHIKRHPDDETAHKAIGGL